MRLEALAAVFLGLFAGACAVVAGLDNDYELDPSATFADAGADASASCSGEPGACALNVPPNWVRVGFSPTRERPCPSGFAQSDVELDPVMDSGACTCGGCVITAPPTCDSGAVATFLDNGSKQCGLQGLVLANSPPGQCAAFNAMDPSVTLGENFKGIPPPPVAGACSLSGAPDGSKVAWTQGRLCVPQSETCELELCSGDGFFAECIMTDGDSDCPDAFPQRHSLGDTSNIGCGACGCVLEATCAGTLELYSDVDCTAGMVALVVNGTCVPSVPNKQFFRYKYIGAINSMICDGEGAPTDAAFAPKKTLCCR